MRPSSILSLLVLLTSAACSEAETSAGPAPTPGRPELGRTPTAAKPGRRIDIEVTKTGYVPSDIAVAAGEPLTLVFTRTSKARCGEKVLVPEAGIEKKLPVDEAVAISVTAPASGKLAFTCGMDMMKGALVVAEAAKAQD